MSAPRDRVFFHYNHFHDAVASSGGDWGLRDPAARKVVRITLSTSPTTRDPGTRVAMSVQQVASALKRDGGGVAFDGVFVIEDARHGTASTVPGGRAVPSQMRILLLAPAATTRLSAKASPDARSLQSALLAAGFSRASFVEVGRTTR
jgi:hypothetical protein